MSTPIDRYYKLFSLSGVSPKLLKNEEHFNLHVRPKKEKCSEQPKAIVWEANAVQDSDLLELPMDPKGYLYSHIVIDVSTQDLDGNPLKSKDAKTVLDSFKSIYERGHVKLPTFRVNTDTGKEFDNHLFRDFFTKEVKEMLTGITSVEWSNDYPMLIEAIRKEWKRDPLPIPEGLPKISNKDDLLQEGTQVRVMLFEPKSVLGQKLHGKFRTGDIRWDPEIRVIKKLILSPEQPPTYLVNGPHGKLGVSRCAYTRKQLQVVPDNENPPPDSVIHSKQYKFIPKKFLSNELTKSESTWEPANRFKEDAPNLVNEFLE
ncbi:11140_t:CDS:2 [Entrophospora sp. SA101]|nr:11140_t:CDS:2 [Entrophospora sp. SA101]CAJ0829874.1 5942_t:CDS:2 [Entrophospora sp. SA101]CAJ0842194.1 19399_t:CDS:2 [Entrophospora sp. SA101]CAJ0844351.1 14635_t:CDS:2 [Entrophospora sp. SA101]